MTISSERLQEMLAAAEKATPVVPEDLMSYEHGGGRLAILRDGHRQLIADFYGDGSDRDHYANCDPATIRELLTELLASRSGAGREAVGAVADIAAERRRQVEAEGWTPEHDDEHDNGELATAAGVYALCAGSQDYRWVLRGSPPNDYLAAALTLWPWDREWLKPKDRRRDLVRAGALIAAEIDRLDRRTLKDNTHGA